jgi:hypothetical protein
VAKRLDLPFDPIARAAQIWEQRFGPAEAMAAVTSIMRAHQLLLGELDGLLRPHGLTFARYEARSCDVQQPRRAAAAGDRRAADGSPHQRHQHH